MRDIIHRPSVRVQVNRRTVLALASYGLGAAAILGSRASNASTAITMRYAGHSPPGHPITLADAAMCERIKSRTNGELLITYFPNNALGSSPQQVEGVAGGSIDFAQGYSWPARGIQYRSRCAKCAVHIRGIQTGVEIRR